jgi:hypothetical protein
VGDEAALDASRPYHVGPASLEDWHFLRPVSASPIAVAMPWLRFWWKVVWSWWCCACSWPRFCMYLCGFRLGCKSFAPFL